MKPLAGILAQWKPAADFGGDPLVRIGAAWPAIVGADVAAHTRPHELNGGVLLVVTRSSAWSQQLSFLSEHIVSGVAEHAGVEVARLRFRVGRIAPQASASRATRARAVRRERDGREPAATLEESLARFRRDVSDAQRAKAAAGWKECRRCGVRILPGTGSHCVPCANLCAQERETTTARLLYEVPWLGFAGIAPLVDGLTLQEYDAIRLRLLRRWRDALDRVRRSGGKRVTTRDRMIASSYVLLKSGLDPERIAPAVVRDLLGDELHNIFYGNENAE